MTFRSHSTPSHDEHRQLNAKEFRALAERLASAWMAADTEAALACFTEDAIYMEPPDIQLYIGQNELHAYFGALTEGTTMIFHNLWFDRTSQVGAGEYTFGGAGQPTAVHGVAVMEVRGGRIARWREYQRRGAAAFSDFLATEGKEWEWTIRTYP